MTLGRMAAGRWAELVGALTLLTRLPVARWCATHPAPQACVWAYPLAGVVAGLIVALVLAAGLAIGLAQPLATLWALAVAALLTGGLHEDGLADTADGFGGGRTTERKLAIMRDSRIGSFGALALVFSVLIRGSALALSHQPVQAVLLAAVLGRGAMLIPLLLLRPARTDGLAATLQGRWGRATAGLALLIPAALWSPQAALAACLAGVAVSALARRQIGGYTGDVLGAVEQLAECAALTAAA